jgi:hypothetical protein
MGKVTYLFLTLVAGIDGFDEKNLIISIVL